MPQPITVYDYLSPVFFTPHAHAFAAFALINPLIVLAIIALVYRKPQIFLGNKHPHRNNKGATITLYLAIASLSLILFLPVLAKVSFLASVLAVTMLPKLVASNRRARAGLTAASILLLSAIGAPAMLCAIHYTHLESQAEKLSVSENTFARGHGNPENFPSAQFVAQHQDSISHAAYPALWQAAPRGWLHGTSRSFAQWLWKHQNPNLSLPQGQAFEKGDLIVRVDVAVASKDNDGENTTRSMPLAYCAYRNGAPFDTYTLMGEVPNMPEAAHIHDLCPAGTGGIPATLDPGDIFGFKAPKDGRSFAKASPAS